MQMRPIHERIRSYRLARGVSQRELAEELSVSIRTISRWECGAGKPPPYIMRAVVEAVRDVRRRRPKENE